MLVPQLGDNLDGIETRVLRQGVRDHLHGVGERLHAHSLHAGQGPGPLAELLGHLHLGRAASDDEEPLLHQATNDAQRIVQRPVSLLDDQLVGAAAEHGHGLAHVLNAGHLDDLLAAAGNLLRQVRVAELLGRELLDVGHRLAADGFADEVHVVALDVADHHDLSLGEVVEGEVGDGVAEDGLLDQQHVAPARLDLLDDGDDVVALLLQDAVHLLVVAHHHRVLHVRLGGRDAKLDQRNLSILNLGRTARGFGGLQVQHEAVDHLGIVDGPAGLAKDLDVLQVHHVRPRLVPDLEHGIHRDWREDVGILRHNLGSEGGGGGFDERGPVVDVEGDGHPGEDLASLVARESHGVRDDRRVHASVEEADALVEEGSAEDGDGGGAVARDDILRLGELDEHLRGGVGHLHLVQDGGAVVGDGHVVVPAHEHLVHPPRAEGGADGVRELLRRAHVGRANVLLELVVGVALTGLGAGRTGLGDHVA